MKNCSNASELSKVLMTMVIVIMDFNYDDNFENLADQYDQDDIAWGGGGLNFPP